MCEVLWFWKAKINIINFISATKRNYVNIIVYVLYKDSRFNDKCR